MIKNKTINPLDILRIRRLDVAPPHFEYVDIPSTYNLEGSLIKWINKNCKKRFYVGKRLTVNSKKEKGICISVGFEDNKEMSYFMLACPHLKYN